MKLKGPRPRESIKEAEMSGIKATEINGRQGSFPIKDAQHLLIYGGSTATGTLAIQFAKLSGYRVLTTCSPRSFELVKSLGADAVYDYNDPNTAAEIRKATANKLKYVLDTISLESSAKFCDEALSTKGGEYTALLTVPIKRENVNDHWTLGYTAVGEKFKFGDKRQGKVSRTVLSSDERGQESTWTPLRSILSTYRQQRDKMESDIQLRLRSEEQSLSSIQDHDHEQNRQLPPIDGGKDAWLFLAACFIIEALIWGKLLLLQDRSFLADLIQVQASPSPLVSSRTTTAPMSPFKGPAISPSSGHAQMGVNYLLAPVSFGILLAFPRLRIWAAPAGFVTMSLALALSSFSTTTTKLIVSQGVFYGLGASVAYSPTIIFMDQWFARRKGLAFGIMWAGTGLLAGVVLPVVLQWLLNTYGYQVALRAWAVILFVLAAPLLYFVKPRVPISASSSMRAFNLSFVLDRTFLIYQAGNIIEALGYFLPTIYLPTYARSLGANNLTASLTIILLNLASVFGCVIMGSLVDRCHATTCILISTVGTVLATFLLWGFAVSLAPLFIFCVAYVVFAGSFTSTWPAILGEVRRKNAYADPGIVFGFLCSGRGIGNVVSGPLSEALMAGEKWTAGNDSTFGGFERVGEAVEVVVNLIKFAVLDDYQNLATKHFAHLNSRVDISSFPDTLDPTRATPRSRSS
ncbi:hypothetical protein ETB97_009745 [Aspergillus alliaceus]|uniref:Major facilitator superfamily (MFS) profile domain-containing protein n=1 Tax=Petromyces alliaceus TaxID=209559 RepID=A0A8H5ZRR5_PETAA|nr:hypothetical protein ETB97_009745 [Aspergillus burnettii]